MYINMISNSIVYLLFLEVVQAKVYIPWKMLIMNTLSFNINSFISECSCWIFIYVHTYYEIRF